MPDVRKTIIDVAAMLAIGLTLALLGPFGTFAAPLPLRIVYWVALLVGGYAIYLPAMVVAGRSAERLALPEAAMWAAACVMATVPMSVVVWCVNFIWGRPRWPGLEDAAATYANVLVVGALACAVLWFVRHRRGDAVAAAPARLLPTLDGADASTASAPPLMPRPTSDAAVASSPGRPPFLDRLPPHLGTTLLALEMEDHYVRAHTPSGSALILMRMRDAVAELGTIDGMQVHRSWWVAQAAVVRSRREGRNHRLILTGGLEAPVARERVADLEARGWI